KSLIITCHGVEAMPQNEKVTFPEGTGGFAASWAAPEQTEHARVAHAAIDRSKRGYGDFMIGGINALSLKFVVSFLGVSDIVTWLGTEPWNPAIEIHFALLFFQDAPGSFGETWAVDAVMPKNFFLASGDGVVIWETQDFEP